MTTEHPFKSAGLTITSTFIPFSQSRNKDSKNLSLNWRVTLLHNGKPVLTTNYGAGIAHAPASKLSIKDVGGPNSLMRYELQKAEAETGLPHMNRIIFARTPILPNEGEVIACLLNDSEALDYASFEDWATGYGYDPDSRSAEKIYRQCLEHGLTLRAALGDTLLAELREVARDY